MKPVLTKINDYRELKEIIRSAGAWFVGAFLIEAIDNYEKTRDRNSKREFIDYFHGCYCQDMEDKQLRNRINCLIRIVESNMVEKALKHVIENTNIIKIGCEDAVENARILLDKINMKEVILPVFE